MSLPVYKLESFTEKDRQYYQIVRPDGSIVNHVRFDDKKFAERFLETLKAFKYCHADNH